MSNKAKRNRLAFVVSHPIQYYAPLYRRLAAGDDIELKVFFTWHGADGAQRDHGFKREVQWDIPLLDGYDYEVVPNKSRNPGTHHFCGLRNPELVRSVLNWRPNAVHITGYAFVSHLSAIRRFHAAGIPILFRGDSHLLDRQPGVGWPLKRLLLSRIYSRVSACLYVGKNNYDYYRALGVPESKLFYCPHSIEVERFAKPDDELERQAELWREALGIPKSTRVVLYAGKLEKKKRPLELMKAVLALGENNLVLVLVGNGELEGEVREVAARHLEIFRVLPFQNQSRMPVVYRLGDIFTLPSAYGETWGLAVNEALASGRRILVSDKVGCAPDVVTSAAVGSVFSQLGPSDFGNKLCSLMNETSDREAILQSARRFDVSATEETLRNAIHRVLQS